MRNASRVPLLFHNSVSGMLVTTLCCESTFFLASLSK
jgi:hypothetical protein